MIVKYFEKVEKVIFGFREIIIDQTVHKKLYNDTQGIISGIIKFTNDSVLKYMELIDTELPEKIKYKYHYMDKDKQMIFRYDNAKHYPHIKTYPHHKHTKDNVHENEEPKLIDVLTEIQLMF